MAEVRYPGPRNNGEPSGDTAVFARRWVRFLCACVPLALAALVLWQEGRVRADEAEVLGKWVGAIVQGPISQARGIVFFPWVKGPLVGLKVTPECTVALLIGPMLLVGAAITAFTRSSIARIAGGLLAGVALLVVVNQVRIGVIAMATQHWGLAGYNLAHQLIGTVIAMAGFAFALVVMLGVSTGHWHLLRRHRAAT